MTDLPSPFESATAELRRLGIDLARLPGEYRVNFHNGTESTAEIADTLDVALEIGRSMAATKPPAKPIRRRRPRRMTAKAHNRRLRRAHMYKLRARALKQQRAVTGSDDKAG
jgi:hypothetical protein